VASVRTRLLIPLVLVAAAAVGGCGQSEDRDQVRDVAGRFAAAVADGNGAAACEQLSDSTVKALEQQDHAPCHTAITQLRLDPGAVERVRVSITNAQAVYATGESAFLDRGPDGWRLSAVGCRFEDGKPRDRPATCEVES
jgi:hypothetical protein